MGNLVGPDSPSAWGNNPSLITIENVNGITIDGSGTIDGRGSSWWNCENKGKGVSKFYFYLSPMHLQFLNSLIFIQIANYLFIFIHIFRGAGESQM